MTQVRSMTQLPNTELRSYHSFTKGLNELVINFNTYVIDPLYAEYKLPKLSKT